MRLNHWFSLLVVLGILIPFAPTASVQAAAEPPESYAGEAVCLPDVFLQGAENCLPAGPSATLTDLARQGQLAKPLPVRRPPAELTLSPVMVAKINLAEYEPAPVYGTLADAVAQSNPARQIAAGEFRYVSIINIEKVEDKAYVQLRSGEWMRASPAATSVFQGAIFTRTPANDFGWIVDAGLPRTAPGYANPETGVTLYRETMVQIYEVASADGVDWYRIGPDSWMERRYIRQVRINRTPPEGVTGSRWIEVNLYDQTLAVYDGGELVFATLVATGAEPYYTRPGVFQIFQKKPLETMQGAFEADRSDFYYLEDVPWTMYFDEARALHGAYWRALYGYEGTHGCVNLSIGDSAWLFQWANEGDWVYVWDPSGQTPTDPAFYGAGGA
jgi:hypothetical protein